MPLANLTHHAMQHLSLNPHQTRDRTPTAFEDELADALERAFSAGHWELEPLLAHINQSSPISPDGQAWTARNFQSLMAKLGR